MKKLLIVFCVLTCMAKALVISADPIDVPVVSGITVEQIEVDTSNSEALAVATPVSALELVSLSDKITAEATVVTTPVSEIDQCQSDAMAVTTPVSELDQCQSDAMAVTTPVSELEQCQSDAMAVTTPVSELEQCQQIVCSLMKATGVKNICLSNRMLNAQVISEWKHAYDTVPMPQNAPAIRQGIKMIAELRSMDYAEANLAYYAAKGYDSVLITINDGDTPDKLVQLASLVRKHKMMPWAAWSGTEASPYPFRSIEVIKRQFHALLPQCEGLILSWRGTSAHSIQPDAKYLSVLCQIAQESNSNLMIIDELYRRGTHTISNSIAGTSGSYISGLGFLSIGTQQNLRQFFQINIDKGNCLALVVGHSSKYSSKNLSWEQAYHAKQFIETQFILAGCIGTITLHGDGLDRGTTIQSTDDIGRFPIPQ